MAFDIAVVGLGYVGLPLVLEVVKSVLSVAGFDVDASLVEALLSGTSHIVEIPDTAVAGALESGFTPAPIDPMSADAEQPTLEEPSTSDPSESTMPGSGGDPPTWVVPI